MNSAAAAAKAFFRASSALVNRVNTLVAFSCVARFVVFCCFFCRAPPLPPWLGARGRLRALPRLVVGVRLRLRRRRRWSDLATDGDDDDDDMLATLGERACRSGETSDDFFLEEEEEPLVWLLLARAAASASV